MWMGRMGQTRIDLGGLQVAGCRLQVAAAAVAVAVAAVAAVVGGCLWACGFELRWSEHERGRERRRDGVPQVAGAKVQAKAKSTYLQEIGRRALGGLQLGKQS